MSMLRRVLCVSAFIVAALAAASGRQQSTSGEQDQKKPSEPGVQDQTKNPPLRVSTNLVHLVAAVSDHRHRFITDLDEKDFKVFEDGKPQPIDFFGRQTDLPLRIGLLLDTSTSIRERLRFEQDASIDFLNGVLRRNRDQAFLMTFDMEPEVIQDFTGDLGLLTSAIQRQRAGGGTSLNDAIYMAAEKLSNPPLPPGPNPQVRRVLVVFSDGVDNMSDRALSESIEMADRAEVAIFSISTSTDWLAVTGSEAPHKLFKTSGDKVLEHYADETGGRVFFPYKIDDLAVSFQDIGSELRSQYFIAYTPVNPELNGKYRKIQVEVDRKGLVVRTRKGYYATARASSALPANQ